MFDSNIQTGGVGDSVLHRCPVGYKILILIATSIALFTWGTLWLGVPVFVIIFSLYWLAGFSLFMQLRQSKSLLWLLVLLFAFSLFSTDILSASVIVLRLVCLFFLANLVTLTTPLSVMMACFERIFIILKPLKCNPAKAALVFSLTLRFIPLLNRLVAEVRQAQAARGLERSLIASIIPVVVLILKMSEEIANALEARGYDA